MVADCLLTGYTSIIFMLRKLDFLDPGSGEPMDKDADIPDTPLVLYASRQLVRILIRLSVSYSNSETICAIMGAYGAYIPCAYLFSKVIHAPDIESHLEDVTLLEELSDCVSIIVKSSSDISPLMRAMQMLKSEMLKRVGR